LNHITDQELLNVWEFGLSHSVLETSLVLLTYIFPENDISKVASFSIGERDARLLYVRELLFGSVLRNTSDCTSCGQKMEWETTTEELKLQSFQENTEPEKIELEYDNQKIQFRLPNSQDMLSVSTIDSKDKQVDQLIQSCMVNSSIAKKGIQKLSEDLKTRIVKRMEEEDPQANIVMNLSCPECENEWNATFDIMQYLWTEINEWAVRFVQDVYLIASNFGWSEKDILEMNRFRRDLYLNMIKQ